MVPRSKLFPVSMATFTLFPTELCLAVVLHLLSLWSGLVWSVPLLVLLSGIDDAI